MKARSYLQRFDNIELAVRQQGAGMPFVWGHNLLGSIRVDDQADIWDWDELERHASLVRYDARGHGNSDGSYDSTDYRWKNLAGDMLAVARSVTPPGQKFVLGGASMGCATALEAALQAPDDVAGLVLATPPTAWRSRPRRAARYRWQASLSAAFGAAPYQMLDLLPSRLHVEDARRRMSGVILRELVQANPLHVQAALEGAAASDMPTRRKLRTLDMPALIFSWKGDSQHPVSTARILAATLPNVEVFTLSEADDVAGWTNTLKDFLSALGRVSNSRAA